MRVKGNRRYSKSILAVVIFVTAVMLAVTLPATAAARGTPAPTVYAGGSHIYVVLPNGHDDTSDIQAALNKCTTPGPPCTVQLVKGTYYISQIAVYNFQGTFVGMGQGQTVIQGLPNLPSPNPIYDTDTVPFWAGLPGPTNPWPVLLTFVGGSFGISGMKITDTYANPSEGWNYLGYYTSNSLWAMVEITGESGQQVFAAVNDVTLIGGPGSNLGFNNADELYVAGQLLPSGWTSAFGDAIPLSGSFSVTNSAFYDASSAVGFQNLLGATGTACFNTVTNTVTGPFGTVGSTPFFFVDLSNSQISLCGNQVTNVPLEVGAIAYQSANKFDLLPSTVYITGNLFRDLNSGADAVWLEDYGPTDGLASTLSAVVSGNIFQTNTTCGCLGSPPSQFPVIGIVSLVSAVTGDNVLLGGGGVAYYGSPGIVSGNVVLGNIVGVELWGASDVSVTANVITNSVAYGIALYSGSSDNTIAHNFVKNSGLYDLYWDGTGTGNVWSANIRSTSSPPGLC